MNCKKILVIGALYLAMGQLLVSPVSAQEAFDASSSVEYDLSYPGLLPDHPLYFLKMARDNLTAFFIGMPLDKAVFALKQADKHVAASTLVVKQQKDISLAQISYATAQNYFKEAIDQTSAAQKQGVNIQEMAAKLQDASKKYSEVLSEIDDSLSADEQKQFDSQQKMAVHLEKSAALLKP